MEKENLSKKTIFLDGVITANPIFVSVLGLCPMLAVSTSVDNAIGMTIALLVVLLLSNVTISLLRKLIPNEIRIPVFILVVATFTTCVDMLMHAFTPDLYKALGIFIPLIVVNCLILGRAEAFASKHSVGNSAMDAIGMALGYGLALLCMSLPREILANQSLTLSNPFNPSQFVTLPLISALKISFFGDSSGAFVMLGIIIAIVGVIKTKRAAKRESAAKALATPAKEEVK